MAYSLKLCAVQVQGHGQWVPDGSLPSCLFAAETLPALEKEGWKGSWVLYLAAFLLSVLGLPLLVGELDHHTSSVLCHWAGLKISIKSHQDHLWVHAGHVIFKIQTYCAWLSHRDSIQISFFLSLILFKKKKEFTIPCITCCINPSHTRPKTAHRREQTEKWDERHQACCW